MKKFFKMFAAVAVCVVAVVALSSCSKDEPGEETCLFQLGISGLHITGTGSDKVVYDYMSQVETAYYSALGMSDGYIEVVGKYSDLKKDMKQKFENAALPEAIDWSEGTYSFTMKLTGVSGANDEVIATKTFTNER